MGKHQLVLQLELDITASIHTFTQQSKSYQTHKSKPGLISQFMGLTEQLVKGYMTYLSQSVFLNHWTISPTKWRVASEEKSRQNQAEKIGDRTYPDNILNNMQPKENQSTLQSYVASFLRTSGAM